MSVPSAATSTNSSIPYSSPETYEDFAQRYPKYLRAYVRHGFVKVGTPRLTEEEYQRRETSLENHLKLLSSQRRFVPTLPTIGLVRDNPRSLAIQKMKCDVVGCTNLVVGFLLALPVSLPKINLPSESKVCSRLVKASWSHRAMIGKSPSWMICNKRLFGKVCCFLSLAMRNPCYT